MEGKHSGSSDVMNLPANVLKDMGNKYFSDGQYNMAIQYYTYAIKKQPNVSTWYSNRALCYVQLQEYNKALLDCRQSIDFDQNNLKAHFFAGKAHLGLGQYEEALTQLVHSHNLALEQHINFGDDITSMIRLAKKKRFEALEEKRKKEEIQLQVYLNNLILDDAKRQGESILTTSGCNIKFASLAVPVLSHDSQDVERNHHHNHHQHHHHQPSSSHINSNDDKKNSLDLPQEIRTQLAEIASNAQKKIVELNDLFSQVDQRRQKREVPDYLCGRISFELMRDPVITPSGITYDRPSIIAHLRQVGHFDPLSRQPLTEDQLIPNLSMKEVMQAYLEENPWAETY